jgi:predicted PurR-regulated permease PerM
MQVVYKGIGLAFALVLGAYLIYQVQQILLIFLLTLLFAIVLSRPVNYLARQGLPRALGILIVLAILSLVVWLTSRALVPVIQSQAEQFATDFPSLLAQVQGLVTSIQSTFGLQTGTDILDPQSLVGEGESLLSSATVSSAVSIGRGIAEALSLSVVALIVTIYLIVQPAQLIEGFISFFPAAHRKRVEDVLGEMYQAVQMWSLGQLISMVFIGVLTAIALSIIGIPYALLIGALSGVLSFIPLLGVLVSIIPPVLLALVTDPILTVWVILAYTSIHQIEAHIIQPLVMSRAVTLHPVVVVFAILIMGTFFGIVGLLLAVPLVAALGVLVRELWIERMDEIGVDPRPTKEKEMLQESKLLKRLSNILRRS